jgi:hypothetical protein
MVQRHNDPVYSAAGHVAANEHMRTLQALVWAIFTALLVVCGAWAIAWFATSSQPRNTVQPAPPSKAIAIATIHLNSVPQGADAITSIGWSCRTPCSMEVPVDRPFTVTFTRPGFAPNTVPVEPKPAQPGGPEPKFAPDPVFAALQPMHTPKSKVTTSVRTAATRPPPPREVQESQSWWCRLFGCS